MARAAPSRGIGGSVVRHLMAGHLARGYRAAGRYRLESELGSSDVSTSWRAVDETLERPVAMRFFDPRLDRRMLIDRAALAASLTHARVVRVFDTGLDGGQFFTVTELIPASLAWARLPLPGADVARIGAQVAEALDYAHGRGVTHGALHAGNVLLSEQGVKVADFGLAAPTLAGGAARPEDDLTRLGEMLATILTADLPPAQRPAGDTPRGLSRIIEDLAAGAYGDARSAMVDLAALAAPATSVPPSRSRVRLAALVAATAVVVGLAGAGAALLGSRSRPQTRQTAAPRVAGTPYGIRSVADFDPLGDGRESRSTVERIYDHDTRTFWSTERYLSSASFSGRKAGVGVILDLGTERAVGKVRVQFVVRGCSFELRYSPVRARHVDDWEVALGRASVGTVYADDFAAYRSRWWLLWITKLTKGVPGAGTAYACGVSEIALYPP